MPYRPRHRSAPTSASRCDREVPHGRGEQEGGRHRAGGAQANEAADDGGRQQEDDDGKLLAVGSADKTIRLWSIANPARPVQVAAPLTGPAGYDYVPGVPYRAPCS